MTFEEIWNAQPRFLRLAGHLFALEGMSSQYPDALVDRCLGPMKRIKLRPVYRVGSMLHPLRDEAFYCPEVLWDQLIPVSDEDALR